MTNDDMKPDLISKKEAIYLSGLTTYTFNKLIRAKMIHPVEIEDGFDLYSRAEIENIRAGGQTVGSS